MKITKQTYERLKRLKEHIESDINIEPKLRQSALRAARNHIGSIIREIEVTNSAKHYYIHVGDDSNGTAQWRSVDGVVKRLDLAEIYSKEDAEKQSGSAYPCDYINNLTGAKRYVICNAYIDRNDQL